MTRAGSRAEIMAQLLREASSCPTHREVFMHPDDLAAIRLEVGRHAAATRFRVGSRWEMPAESGGTPVPLVCTAVDVEHGAVTFREESREAPRPPDVLYSVDETREILLEWARKQGICLTAPAIEVPRVRDPWPHLSVLRDPHLYRLMGVVHAC